MPATKVTLLFNHATKDSGGNPVRAAGHSESYYSTLAIDNPALQTIWNTLCQKRAALLPANISIIGSRYQKVDPRGASRSFDNIYPATTSSENDLPGVAMQWTVRSANTFNQKSLILPGVPDDRVRTGEYRSDANYNARLTDFFEHLIGNWVWRAKDRSVAKAKIVTVAANGLITTATPHGLAVNDFVSVQSTNAGNGIPQLISYRGSVVTVVNATQVNVLLLGRSGWPEPSQLGTIQKELIIYPPFSITTQEIVRPRIIHRKVGSNFLRFRGRRTRNH